MTVSAQLLATVRRGLRGAYTDGVFQPEINNGGDLLVGQALPAHTELVRLGTRWSTSIPTANPFNSVALWPTTRAELVISNGENAGGKSYFIDTVWAFSNVTITVATSFTVLGQISNAGVALAANNTACLRTGSSGKIYNGNAAIAIANASAFAIANKWTVLGQSAGHGTNTVGAGCFCDVNGRFVVPPGATFCVNVVASTATATTMIMGIDWYELAVEVL